jgi:hypothetical protein
VQREQRARQIHARGQELNYLRRGAERNVLAGLTLGGKKAGDAAAAGDAAVACVEEGLGSGVIERAKPLTVEGSKALTRAALQFEKAKEKEKRAAQLVC